MSLPRTPRARPRLRDRLMTISERLNSPQAHAWAGFGQSVAAALGAALAAVVVTSGPRWLLLLAAVPLVALALLGGVWVICASPAARRKHQALQADFAAFLAELHATPPPRHPRRPRPDEDL